MKICLKKIFENIKNLEYYYHKKDKYKSCPSRQN